MHLLLRSKSFERWPLSVRFFATDVYKVFTEWDEGSNHHVRTGIDITLDPLATPEPPKKRRTKKGETTEIQTEGAVEPLLPKPNPIERLDFGYLGMKPYLEKSKEKIVPGANITCAVCKVRIEVENSLTLVCPHHGCNATSHLQCLSAEFVRQENGNATNEDSVVPLEGSCPSCNTPTNWRTLVQELSLRTRGQKEVEKLSKKPRKKKGDAVEAVGFVPMTDGLLQEAMDLESDADESDDEQRFRKFEEEAIKTASQDLATETSTSDQRQKGSPIPYVNDSDWDDVEVLD
jgi:structure-specific endonuclease subunit SLX1